MKQPFEFIVKLVNAGTDVTGFALAYAVNENTASYLHHITSKGQRDQLLATDLLAAYISDNSNHNAIHEQRPDVVDFLVDQGWFDRRMEGLKRALNDAQKTKNKKMIALIEQRLEQENRGEAAEEEDESCAAEDLRKGRGARMESTDDVEISSNLFIVASRLHEGRNGFPRILVLSGRRPAETTPDAAGSESSFRKAKCQARPGKI